MSDSALPIDLFFDLARDLLCIVDAEGRFVRVNPAFQQVLGYAPDDLLGQFAFDLLHPDDRESTLAVLNEQTQDGAEIRDFINRYRHHQGHYVWISWNSRPAANGYIYAQGRDITPTMDYQQALEDYAQQVSTIFERISDAVFALDTDWRFTYMNARAGEILQRNHRELIGKNVWAEFPEAVNLAFYAHYQQAVQSQQKATFQEYFPPLDIWFEVRVFPSPEGLSVFFQDITERVRNEERLRHGEAQYRLLIDNFPNGIVALFDRDLRYTFVGGSEFAPEGPGPEAWIGKRLDELFPSEIAQRDLPKLEAALRGEATTSDVAYAGRHHRVFTLPIKDDTGQIIGGMVMTQDTTQQHLNQQNALKLEQESARRVVLRRFMQDVAHEFRTPLARINTTAYRMLRSDDPAERETYHQRIESLVGAIAHLVDELNEITHLDTQPEFDLYLYDLRAILRASVDELADSAQARDIRVTLNCPTAACHISGDADRLQTALHNLLENALQYTPPGGQVWATVAEQDDHYLLTVRDNGPGITAEHLPYIFERFYRSDIAHSTPGFGLGLPIAKAIIEGHGGKIRAEDAREGGACFYVTLPQAASGET
ncbi:MAG: PAS domain-containing protein, partial [Anaerolineales bacterium]